MAIRYIQERTVSTSNGFSNFRMNFVIEILRNCSDIGEHLRHKVSKGFPQGESSKVNIEEWTKFVEHLENIANNKSLKSHPRILKSSATGLSVDECKEIVSTDFLKFLQGQENLISETGIKKQN